MKKKLTNITYINNKISKIKKLSESFNLTNYFWQPLKSHIFEAYECDNAIIFIDKDTGFYRLYYFSANLNDLKELINKVDLKPITIDYITKKYADKINSVFIECGYERIALYKRIVNNNLPIFQTNDELCFARLEEIDFLYNRLFDDFNKYLDHIPSKHKIKDLITNQNVIVTHEKKEISGYIIFRLQGKKAFLNYWYNEGKPMNALSLLINFYGLMVNNKISSVYGWVNENKKGVIKTHQKFGFIFDGLEDYIYKKNK